MGIRRLMGIKRLTLSARASAGVWLVLLAVVALDQAWPVPAPPHTAAFLGFLIPIIGWGLQLLNAVGRITLAALHAAFLIFRTSMIGIVRGLRSAFWGVGKLLGQSLDVFKWLYGNVVRPALSWTFRKLRALEQYLKVSFQPLFEKIRWLKEQINVFYRRFVRPVLDLIDIVRQANRVLKVFHINVLQKLDTVLAQVERRIEEPFLWIYRRLTDVENWLNRIVGLDGLFQRLTLVRSIERDIRQISRAFGNWRHRDVDPRTYAGLSGQFSARGPDAVARDIADVMLTGGGAYGNVSREIAAQWSIYLRR